MGTLSLIIMIIGCRSLPPTALAVKAARATVKVPMVAWLGKVYRVPQYYIIED
jgi:hypothetical protein